MSLENIPKAALLLSVLLSMPLAHAADETGEGLYNGTCIACHGSDGSGTIPGTPDFSANDGPLQKTDDELIQSIMEGFQSPGSPMAMPAKGGNPALTEEDARQLVAYLRAAFGD